MPSLRFPLLASDKPIPDLVKNTVETILYPRGQLQHHNTNESTPRWTRLPEWERVLYTFLVFIPFLITVFLFARRCRRLTFKKIRHMTYIRLLVIMSYIIAIVFSLSSFALVVHGIKTLELCRNSIYICIGFLFAGKIAMQLFLIERAHVANVNYLRRRDDPFWWISMGVTAIAVVGLTVWTYINPVYFMSPKDGRCRKGLPPNVVAPLQAYEITLNIILTIVFVRMLQRSKQQALFAKRPQAYNDVNSTVRSAVSKVKGLAGSKTASKNTKEEEIEFDSAPSSFTFGSTSSGVMAPLPVSQVDFRKVDYSGIEVTDLEIAPVVLPASTRPSRLRNLARKSLIGTLFMLLWTITNNVVFYCTRGRENAWMCFIQCNYDVILSVFVLHWLTSDPKDDACSTDDIRSSVAEMPTFNNAPMTPEIPSAREGTPFSRRDSYAKWGSRRDTVVSHDSPMVGSDATMLDSRRESARERGDSILQIPTAAFARSWERRRSSANAPAPAPAAVASPILPDTPEF